MGICCCLRDLQTNIPSQGVVDREPIMVMVTQDWIRFFRVYLSSAPG